MFRHLVQTATLPGPCPAAAAVAVTGTLVVNSGITVPGASDANAPALLGSPRGVVAGLFGPFTVFLGAISAGFVASLLATDLAMGTVRTQLIVHPRRPSLLAGKLSAVAAVLLLAALVAGVLAAANVLAAVPALLAARSHPGQLLRAE